jgi:hypothetical protein
MLLVSGVALIGACSTDVPSEPRPPALRPADAATPSHLIAGNSGCFIVSGTISETGVPPNFTGTVSGDLVGTSSTMIGEVAFTGAVGHLPGERTLTITGGTIPQLVGVTIHETFDGLTVANGQTLIHINERTRIDAGATGNITTHGTLNAAAIPFQVEVEYKGQICL